jgi:hypothetical protein
VGDYTKWKCNHFAISMPEEKLPTLLRRVAAQIEKIKPDFVHNIVVRTDATDVTATVYYSLPKPLRRSKVKRSVGRGARQ